MQKMKMMDFDAAEVRQWIDQQTADLSLSLKAEDDEQAQSSLQMIEALKSNIDIMQRVDADYQANGADSISLDEINQIGEYAMTLISELAMLAANRGLQQIMIGLIRLSVPVSSWLVNHKGKIAPLDILVNAIASYANELTEPEILEQLCHHIENVMQVIEDDVKRDMEATNPMRPWRILNLNWGIVATRSHNAELIEKVYTQLMKNIPADINDFITEAMQQMDVIGYPDHVRQIVAKFYATLGSNQALH